MYVGRSVSRFAAPLLWSTLKYFNNYYIDGGDILHRQWWSPEDEPYWLVVGDP